MILQETVLVTLSPLNIKYYESLGYFIPRYKDRFGRIKIKKGTKIKVKVSDLPKGSNIKVLCKCDNCGKEKLVIYNNLNSYGPKYFCNKCACNTKEHKEKLRKINQGKHLSTKTKIKISKSNTGKKHLNKTKKKLKNFCYSKGKFGSDHPAWKGGLPNCKICGKQLRTRKAKQCKECYHKNNVGINHNNYNPNLSKQERTRPHTIFGISRWKKEVKERDNYTCQCCGSKEHLHAHHIDNFKNFKNQRLLVENGVILCKDCHKAIHKQFGKFTIKENLIEFLKLNSFIFKSI